MFDITTGSAFAVSEQMLRLAMVATTALSEDGATTPRVLQAALVAPYVDGFAFVQELRRRGGWAAVDAAWQELPASTEQLLHLDKYLAREPVAEVPIPPLDALGSGWAVDDQDVLGEQGLRLALEQWTHRADAHEAASGWGGDRYVVAQRAELAGGGDEAARANPGRAEHAVGWLMRFDTVADAQEVAAVLGKTFGPSCTERAELGAVAWTSRARAIALAIGPYARGPSDARLSSPPSCPLTRRWATAMLGAVPP